MTQLPKIIVLISGRGSNMKAICEACNAGDIKAQVVKIISNRADAAGLDYARSEKIPYNILNHRDYDSREAFDRALAELVLQEQPDLICLAGFMRILTPIFVAPFAGKILNIHPSLLPKYKGLDTHRRAIEAGDKQAGASVHYVTPELDDGPVVAQTCVDIAPDDTPQTLADKVLPVEHATYIDAIRKILR